MAILIAGCGATSALIGNAQAKSRKHAIIIVTKSFYVAKGNRYVAPVELRSQ